MLKLKALNLLIATITFVTFTMLGPVLAQDSEPSTAATAEITTTTTTQEAAPAPVAEVKTTETTVEDTATTVTTTEPDATAVETRSIEVKPDDEVVAVEGSNQGLLIVGGLLLLGVIVGGIAMAKK